MSTDRRSDDQTRREREEQFRRLSSAANEGITIVVDDGIAEANNAFGRLFGYELSKAVPFFYFTFVSLIILAFLLWWLLRSPWGRAFAALRRGCVSSLSTPLRAECVYNVRKTRKIFAKTCFLTTARTPNIFESLSGSLKQTC